MLVRGIGRRILDSHRVPGVRDFHFFFDADSALQLGIDGDMRLFKVTKVKRLRLITGLFIKAILYTVMSAHNV